MSGFPSLKTSRWVWPWAALMVLGVPGALAGTAPVKNPAATPTAQANKGPGATSPTDSTPVAPPSAGEPGRPATSLPRPERGFPRRPFSFGLTLGLPVGLEFQTRFLERNAVVAHAAYDYVYRGVSLGVDYRFTVWTLEFIKYDARLGVWVGVGARASLFEPRVRYKLTSPVAVGGHVPVGMTLRLADLPMEVGLSISPLGFDVNALALPRWRPSFGLETRILFPLDLGW